MVYGIQFIGHISTVNGISTVIYKVVPPPSDVNVGEHNPQRTVVRYYKLVNIIPSELFDF